MNKTVQRDYRHHGMGLLLAAALATPAAAEDSPREGLVITINCPGCGAGTARLAVFGRGENYLKKALSNHTVEIAGDGRNSGSITLVGLAKGEYVLTAYFDRNGNGKLDKGLFGIPSEPWGFSRDAAGRFGPPTFDEARIDYPGKTMQTSFTLR